jgi:hypothetical protein
MRFQYRDFVRGRAGLGFGGTHISKARCGAPGFVGWETLGDGGTHISRARCGAPGFVGWEKVG